MNHAQAILHSQAVIGLIAIGGVLRAVTTIAKFVRKVLRIVRPGTGRHRR
ncbi:MULTISPECIES: hypothetical protein [unclassified Streptomyces]|nr:hypothetical protein [Streptomyces sp. CB01883]